MNSVIKNTSDVSANRIFERSVKGYFESFKGRQVKEENIWDGEWEIQKIRGQETERQKKE